MSYFSSNKIYAWMIVFIISMQILSLALKAGPPLQRKDPGLAREEFRIEIENRQEALRRLLQENRNLAYNFSIIFMLGVCVFITGIVFLVNYIKGCLDGKQAIQRTLDMPDPLWSLGDVFKAVIFFIFFHTMFSAAAFSLRHIIQIYSMDFRLDATASTLVMDIIMLFFVCRIVKHNYGQGLEALGLSLRNLSTNIKSGLYIYIAFLPLLLLVFLAIIGISRMFNYVPPPQPVYEIIFKEQRPLVLLMAAALIAFIGPFIEEVFFRGFLYGALRKTFGILWAVLLSSFLFALLHMNILGFIPIMLLGIMLAYLRERTGSLVPAVTVHVIHNGVLTGMMFAMRILTAKAA